VLKHLNIVDITGTSFSLSL